MWHEWEFARKKEGTIYDVMVKTVSAKSRRTIKMLRLFAGPHNFTFAQYMSSPIPDATPGFHGTVLFHEALEWRGWDCSTGNAGMEFHRLPSENSRFQTVHSRFFTDAVNYEVFNSGGYSLPILPMSTKFRDRKSSKSGLTLDISQLFQS